MQAGSEGAKSCAASGSLRSGTTLGSASPIASSESNSLHWPEPWELNSQVREATGQLREELRAEVRAELGALEGRSVQLVATERLERELQYQELRQGLQYQERQGDLCSQSLQDLQRAQGASTARFREVAEKAAVEECAKKQGVINEMKHDLDTRLRALGARLDSEVGAWARELERAMDQLEGTFAGERAAQTKDIGAIWERVESLLSAAAPVAVETQAQMLLDGYRTQLTRMQSQTQLDVDRLSAAQSKVEDLALKVDVLMDELRGVEQKQVLASESLAAHEISISKFDAKVDGELSTVRDDLRSAERKHEEVAESIIAQMTELWDHSSKVVQQLSELAARFVAAGHAPGTAATRSPTPVRPRPAPPRAPAS